MKFSRAIQKYVAWKNLRGIQFRRDTPFLNALRKQTGDCHLDVVTSQQILSYLDGQRMSPATWWRRYRMFNAFFQFWLLRGQVNRLPMPRPRAAWPHPFKPYIYSREELALLLDTTRSTQLDRSCVLDQNTVRTLLLFIYGTGARLAEALSLRLENVDLRKRLVTVPDPREGRARTIPFGRNLEKCLRSYLISCAGRRVSCLNFFLDKKGKAIADPTFRGNFQRLLRRAGIRQGVDATRPPGIRDLRHTFAVHRLSAWLKQGKNPRRMLPVLSAYMGHVKWTATEQYLSLTPERFLDQLSRLGPVELLSKQGIKSPHHVKSLVTGDSKKASPETLNREETRYDETGKTPPPNIRWRR
jgi:integrase/recombinase XerD